MALGDNYWLTAQNAAMAVAQNQGVYSNMTGPLTGGLPATWWGGGSGGTGTATTPWQAPIYQVPVYPAVSQTSYPNVFVSTGTQWTQAQNQPRSLKNIVIETLAEIEKEGEYFCDYDDAAMRIKDTRRMDSRKVEMSLFGFLQYCIANTVEPRKYIDWLESHGVVFDPDD